MTILHLAVSPHPALKAATSVMVFASGDQRSQRNVRVRGEKIITFFVYYWAHKCYWMAPCILFVVTCFAHILGQWKKNVGTCEYSHSLVVSTQAVLNVLLSAASVKLLRVSPILTVK